MPLENWVLSLSKFKQTVLQVVDIMFNRVTLESTIDDEGVEGAKAVWMGEPGERAVEVNAPALKGNVTVAGEKAPAIEYWQRGARRGFSLHNPKSVSVELDEEALENIETLKAAGISVIVGAFAGLIGWLTLIGVSRATLVKAEKKERPILHIESKAAESDDDEESAA
jgi:hypothetical protein